MLIQNPLVGEKVTLRPFKEGDMDFWSRWDIDPAVQEFLPEPRPVVISPSDQLEYFSDCLLAQNEVHATIVHNDTDEPVGTIALTEIDNHHGVGEINIVIGDTTRWGKGIATEAITLMLSEKNGLRRVVAEFEDSHAPMRKALQKNGFEIECTCKKSRIKNGEEIDTVRMVKFL